MTTKPSMETLFENSDVGIEVFHPGGMEMTGELADMLGIREGQKVLDVASGSGESACYLAEKYKCDLTGIDFSEHLVEKARKKAEQRQLNIPFVCGDAHQLPFADNTFDCVMAECAFSLLDKEKALSEILRVLKPGGRIGLHDIYWNETASEELKKRLLELEDEQTETISEWRKIFERVGFQDLKTIDKPNSTSNWIKETKKQLGLKGQMKIFFSAYKQWGLSGLLQIKKTEAVFRDPQLGYALFAARKQEQGESK